MDDKAECALGPGYLVIGKQLPRHVLGSLIRLNQDILSISTLLYKYGHCCQDGNRHNAKLQASQW